ncbi:ABC transporter permease [Nocardioides limicola]|uniref:ABC transporter permease n=1 Tax=Nocardioides limicola TaxID=2803368 RepID=UPI00193B1F24|nr:hypothetical protein [Nocardioides sp. DJM-14]
MKHYTGTGHLVRLILRRDRLILPAWILGNATMALFSANAVIDFYSDDRQIALYSRMMGDNITNLIMAGREAGLDTIGGIAVNEVSFMAGILISLMVLFTVVRHTRSDEEAGRTELVRSTVVGRHAPVLAALTVAILASVMTGALIAGAFIVAGVEAGGSLAFGASLAGLGVVFASSAAVAAQVSVTGRGALGIGGAVIAITFAIRGIAAIRDSPAVWLSPFGWAQAVESFGERRWWVLLVLVTGAALGFLLTAALGSRRDVGGGLLEPKLGRPRASGLLSTDTGFVWRTQRGLIFGWGALLLLLAALYGSIVTQVPEMLEQNPEAAAMFGDGAAGEALIDFFVAYISRFQASLLAAFTVMSVLRLRTEEQSGRAEAHLATAVPRWRWASANLLVSGLATVVLLTLVALTFGGVYALMDGNSNHLWLGLSGALVQLPAIAVVASGAFAIWGWTSTAWGWLVFACALVQTMLSDLLRFPDWLSALSPFWHTPAVPAESAEAWPLVILSLVAAALLALGFLGLRRRDIVTT